MKKLRRMAGGDTYTIIYLKMQLLSLRNKGLIIFDGVEDDLANELALELDETVEDMQMTLLFLSRHGLLEQLTEAEYLLREAVENTGEESSSAERMRRFRKRQQEEKKLVSHCDTLVTTCDKKVALDKEKRSKKKIRDSPSTPRGSGEQSSESFAFKLEAGAGIPVGHSMTLSESFNLFWDTYPNKKARNAAEKAWRKIGSSPQLVETILAAIVKQKLSQQWLKDNGQYIPEPANWLKDKRWMDELAESKSPDQMSGQKSSSYDLSEIQVLLNKGML